jgi:hypothetical protein
MVVFCHPVDDGSGRFDPSGNGNNTALLPSSFFNRWTLDVGSCRWAAVMAD